ncbi:MAG: alpha/beta hydrolase [Alphaproteobacteria bacterium]|nr:alpha/beta hydrolase [Alphaproteobacteria bacterium]MBU2380567.1 alpha/beta hydrolase [Alphaproteobacteria bacterium]
MSLTAEQARRSYVLVHGGGYGGWAWKPVARLLRAAGHEVYAPTLSGLAERSGTPHASITLQCHIDEIVGLMAWEDLTDVVLVAHSYGGFVITGAADAAPERIATLVYLDAFVPEDGQSLASILGDGHFALSKVSPDGASLEMPITPAAGLTAERKAWLKAQTYRHPVATVREPIRLTGAWDRVSRKVYVQATGWRGLGGADHFTTSHDRAVGRADWDAVRLDVGHDLMLEAPQAVTDLLLRYA